MGKKEFGEYFLGLDIGTDSVGWAVTDLEYNLLRFNGNGMWGIRLFDPAQTAETRRAFRIARRRIQRRNQRLALLQDLFAEQINKVDPGFFMRLQEGALHEEDKTERQKNNLFNDKGFDDKAYHKKYPTIYHLRRELINSKEAHDIRLVYLAIHHILKYRGHFLFEGELETSQSLKEIMSELNKEIYDEFGFTFECESDKEKEMEKILLDQQEHNSNKQKELSKLIKGECDNPTRKRAFINLLSGKKVKTAELFILPKDTECDVTHIDFSSDNYEADALKLQSVLGQDRFFYVEKLKSIRDWVLLTQVMNGKKSYSCAKAAIYDQHAKDLKQLKCVIRKYLTADDYKAMFSAVDNPNNYCAYSGMAKRNGRKQVIKTRCSAQDFYKFVKKMLESVPKNDSVMAEIMLRLEKNTFMPKGKMKSNSLIPYQLHKKELKEILDNASCYLSFFKRKGRGRNLRIRKNHADTDVQNSLLCRTAE